MLTPSSTARTAPAPDGAVNGSSTKTAGRLLKTLASAAASVAVASSAGNDVPPGSSGAIAMPSPLSVTALTTMPRPSTNSRKGKQRRRIRQVRAGVHVRPGPHLQPRRGGEHHRGEQDHGGVQAEYGRGHRRDAEHLGEQLAGASGAGPRHPPAAG